MSRVDAVPGTETSRDGSRQVDMTQRRVNMNHDEFDDHVRMI